MMSRLGGVLSLGISCNLEGYTFFTHNHATFLLIRARYLPVKAVGRWMNVMAIGSWRDEVGRGNASCLASWRQ
jgi:hypothetical protein